MDAGVIEAEIGSERGRPLGRAAIGHAVRPLAQQRLNDALRLSIGLRPVRARKAVTDEPAATHRGKHAGPIDLGIGEARGVVDRDVQLLVARVAAAATTIPMDAMTNADDASQPLHIEMQQVAHVRPLVALHGLSGV